MARAPRQGDLLIADPGLTDPNFDGTVILLCRHSDEGTFGLVLNRNTHLTLEDTVEDPGELEGKQIAIRFGGPVGLDHIHVLHGGPDTVPDSQEVVRGVQFGAEFRALARLHSDGVPVRFYLGYAGWDEGQLADEMEAGAWRLLRASARTVFAADVGLMWPQLMSKLDPEFRWMRHLPPDPWSAEGGA